MKHIKDEGLEMMEPKLHNKDELGQRDTNTEIIDAEQ
jgi:hypothetical protein